MADKNSQSKNVNKDSGADIDLTDIEDISLEDLDDFEGIDFDNLDLDDIDFDDLDVTSLDTGISYQKEPLDTDEYDFDFDSLLAEDKVEEKKSDKKTKKSAKKENPKKDQADKALNDDAKKQEAKKTGDDKKKSGSENAKAADSDDDVFAAAEKTMKEDTTDLSQDDIDAFLSALNSETPMSDSGGVDSEDYSGAGADLDDLFKQSAELSIESGELDDIEDRSEELNSKGKSKKGKKSLSEILFGEPDEDDEEEVRLLAEKKAQKEIKKSENAEKKSAKKAEKEAKKKETLAVKDKASRDKAQKKAQAKAEKKAAQEAEYLAELEAEGNTKPVSTRTVIVVFAAFAALGLFVVFGTKHFDYSRVIEKATDYFERQRYRLAYDEIAGVEVKSKDEELKDRVYTVMYVERLYESYENNMKVGRTDKALDALLRGLVKYDEHYEEAVELDIAGDIDTCKQQILNALNETFSMSEEDAYAIINLDGQEYTTALAQYAGK
jgi:hypothetical protein